MVLLCMPDTMGKEPLEYGQDQEKNLIKSTNIINRILNKIITNVILLYIEEAR